MKEMVMGLGQLDLMGRESHSFTKMAAWRVSRHRETSMHRPMCGVVRRDEEALRS